MADCLFCRIIRGEVPSRKVYEDEHTFAFEDLNPQGPTHVLVIPKRHIAGLKEAAAEDAELVGRCHLTAAHIARERSIEDGYRTVLNVGRAPANRFFISMCTRSAGARCNGRRDNVLSHKHRLSS